MIKSDRMSDIDVAKGVAILLVVTGHVVARDYRPSGNEWFMEFRSGLYYFHMSFFFYLAGYVFFTSKPDQYSLRLERAARRMIPAYLLVAVLAFIAKWILAPVVPVDRPIRSFWGDWIGLLLYPVSGFITFVWFIVALLLIYALMLLVSRLIPNRPWIWFALAVCAHVASVTDQVTDLFALQQVTRYWLIFMLGYYALDYRASMLQWMRWSWPVWLLTLIVALNALPREYLLTIPAILSIPALHGLSLWITEHTNYIRAGLTWLGEASWPIYLFNAFAIGAVKVIILKTFGWDGTRFLLALPLLVIGGLMLPVLAQRMLLARFNWLNRVTR